MTSEIIPTLYVVTMIIRHFLPAQQHDYMNQVISLNNQWFKRYGELYGTEDIWLYPLAEFDQTDSVLPTAKSSVGTLVAETLKMPQFATTAKKHKQSSGRTFKKFVFQFSYLWLRCTCSGNSQLWKSFQTNAASSFQIFIKRAHTIKLTYNTKCKLSRRLDDSSINFIYCITHLVFWLSNWCTAVIPANVVPPQIAMEAVTVMTSWIKSQIEENFKRLAHNHEIWGELAVSSITLIMGLSYDDQCEDSMKTAIHVLAAYYVALNKAFDNADQTRLTAAPNALSLYVPSDFDRALILDVNVHTHLIIAWFATLMPEFKAFMLQPSSSSSAVPLPPTKSTNTTEFRLPSELHSSTKQDIRITSANTQLMSHGHVNLETLHNNGYILAAHAFEPQNITFLRDAIMNDVELQSLLNQSKLVDFTIQVHGGMLVGDEHVVISPSLQAKLLEFAHAHVKPFVAPLGESVRLLEVAPQPTKLDPKPEKGYEMFLRLKAHGTGTVAHYDSFYYMANEMFNADEDFMPDTFVTCWIPLQGIRAANGSLCLLKDSHKRYVSLEAAMKEKGKKQRPSNTQDLYTWLIGDYQAGDCVIFPGTMVHGAFNNKAAETRLSLDVRVVIPRAHRQITRCLSSEFDSPSIRAQPSTRASISVAARQSPLNDSYADPDSTDTEVNVSSDSPNSASQSQHSENAKIEDVLDSSGYHFIEVLGDGHCFYRCIAIAILENESRFGEIRLKVHAWLKERVQHDSPTRRLVEQCNDRRLGNVDAVPLQYLEKIVGATPFPAGCPEIKAATAIYSLTIKVLHHEQALVNHCEGRTLDFKDDFQFPDVPAGKTVLFFHYIGKNHLNLISNDRTQASKWRKLSQAYELHNTELGGTVRSLPELPAPLDAECDVELIDDDILESKYDDDPNDEDYQPSITSTMQALLVDPAEADTESEEQEPADKPTQCRRTSARPYSTIRRCLSIGDQKVKKRVQKMQADHLIAIEQRGPDDVRKRIKEAKRNENLPDNAAFTQIKNLPPSLQFLDIPPFVVAVTKVWDHCGKANMDKNIPSAGELCNQEKLYDARLKLRMQLNWNGTKLKDWVEKRLSETLVRSNSVEEEKATYEFAHELLYEGLAVCHACFQKIYDIKDTRFSDCKARVLKGERNHVHKASLESDRTGKAKSAKN